MKIIHTADWQFGKTSIPNSIERQESALLELCEYAITNNINEILVAGDIFQKHVPTQYEKDALLSILFEFERAEINLRFIIGNHDKETIGEYHSLQTFSILDHGNFFKHIHVYDQPGLYIIENKYNLIVISDEYPLMLDSDFRTKCPTVLTYHGIVKGASADNDFTFTEGLDLGKAVAQVPFKIDYIALGDIHKRQRIKYLIPTFYSGALLQHTFGEQSAGFLVVQLLQGGVSMQEYDITSVPRVQTINVDISELSKLKIPSGHITKIVLHGTPEEKHALDLPELKRQFIEKGCINVVWDFKLKTTNAKVRRMNKISSTSSIEEDFDTYVNSFDELNLDLKKLKSYFTEVLKEL